MLTFEFDRALFRFRENTPALEPLFQFPPRIGRRFGFLPQDYRVDLSQPPIIFPISVVIFDQFSYFLVDKNLKSFASLM